MITIAWEAYSLLFPAHSQEDFERLLSDAELRMDVLTANRWRNVAENDWRAARVKRCLAELVSQSIEDEQGANQKGVTSISNDGYSESYVTLTAEVIRENQRASAAKWLSCTGLVSAL